MRIRASEGQITLNVPADIVLFDKGVTVFNYQNAFSEVFVDLIGSDGGEGFGLNANACLLIEADHVVAGDLGAVVVALDEHSVEFVVDNADVLTDDCLAEELFIGATNDAIAFVALYLIERNEGEGTIDLNAFFVLHYHVAADLWLAG